MSLSILHKCQHIVICLFFHYNVYCPLITKIIIPFRICLNAYKFFLNLTLGQVGEKQLRQRLYLPMKHDATMIFTTCCCIVKRTRCFSESQWILSYIKMYRYYKMWDMSFFSRSNSGSSNINLQFFNQKCIGKFQLLTTSTRDLGNSIYCGLLTVRPLKSKVTHKISIISVT